MTATKVDYGIDAPTVVRNLILGGLAPLLIAIFLPVIRIGSVKLLTRPGFYYGAFLLFLTAALMLLYCKSGKFRHRDRMIALARLQNDHRVLDVGTGRGLLLIAAAKRLTDGRAVGIDIWSRQDLSSNSETRTRANLEAEGVTDRCDLLSGKAQAMDLPSGSFDVVLSLMCLHNIPAATEREQACREIVRVLKPGGVAVISDYRHTGRYETVFRQSGLTTERKSYPFDTFPPVAVVIATKAKT